MLIRRLPSAIFKVICVSSVVFSAEASSLLAAGGIRAGLLFSTLDDVYNKFEQVVEESLYVRGAPLSQRGQCCHGCRRDHLEPRLADLATS